MENPEVDPLGGALRRAFDGSPELQPDPEFIANLAALRHLQPAPSTRPRTTRWLAMAATLALLTAGGYWTFEARLSADPLRDAVIGDHRYCALGVATMAGKRPASCRSRRRPISTSLDFTLWSTRQPTTFPTPVGLRVCSTAIRACSAGGGSRTSSCNIAARPSR